MAKAKKVTVSERDFKAFVKVQMSGRTNMFDVRTVGILSGLDKETIMAVIDEYDALSELYPKVVA
jgi:Cu/Ag efflux protein CusF